MTRGQYVKLMIAITSAMAAALAGYFALPIIIGALMDSLHINEVSAGLVSTTELITVALAAIVLAPLMPRLSRRWLAIAGIAIAGGANFLSALPESLVLIVALRFLAGCGGGMALAAAEASLTTVDDPDRLYALVCLFMSLWASILLGIIPYPVSTWGLAGAFATLGIALILLLPFVSLLPGIPEAHSSKTHDGNAPQTRVGVIVCAAGFILTLSMTGVWTFAERIGTRCGLSKEELGMSLALSLIVGLTGALLAAWLGKRHGRRIPLIVGYLTMGITALVFAGTHSSLVFLAMLYVNMPAVLFSLPFSTGAAADLDREGRWVVAFGGMTLLGMGVGSTVAGGTIALWGYQGLGWFSLITVTIALLMMLHVVRFLEERNGVVVDGRIPFGEIERG